MQCPLNDHFYWTEPGVLVILHHGPVSVEVFEQTMKDVYASVDRAQVKRLIWHDPTIEYGYSFQYFTSQIPHDKVKVMSEKWFDDAFQQECFLLQVFNPDLKMITLGYHEKKPCIVLALASVKYRPMDVPALPKTVCNLPVKVVPTRKFY